ncbi:MAG: hypothetical protein ACLRM8_03430 [Alistipes sp.]
MPLFLNSSPRMALTPERAVPRALSQIEQNREAGDHFRSRSSRTDRRTIYKVGDI